VFKLGLTGGIGCGKTTVAALLRQRGAWLIDADAIAHEISAPGGLAVPELEQVFGTRVLTPQGGLDRALMRQLAFADASLRQRLESVLHPMIGHEIAKREQQAQAAGAACVIYDIPLLLQSDRWRRRLDRVLVVDCLPETQIQRVMQRSALARADIEQIISSQLPRWERLRGADMVLFNQNRSLDQLSVDLAQMAPHLGL